MVWPAGDVEVLPDGSSPVLPSPVKRIRPAAYEVQDSVTLIAGPHSTFDSIQQADAPHAANTEEVGPVTCL